MHAILAITHSGPDVRLVISGELDDGDDGRLRARLADALDLLTSDPRSVEGGTVELDLRDLRSIDQDCLDLLRLFQTEAVAEGQGFEIVALPRRRSSRQALARASVPGPPRHRRYPDHGRPHRPLRSVAVGPPRPGRGALDGR